MATAQICSHQPALGQLLLRRSCSSAAPWTPLPAHRGHAHLPGRRCCSSPSSPTDAQRAGRRRATAARVFPFDQAWSPNVAAASIAPQLFAFSLFPYLAFLFFLHKSGKAPKLTLVGFYFLLAFVGATIPAGIYAKVHYGTSLANVDWLHGSAESLLTVTNLLIVLGLRQSIREEEAKQALRQAGKQPEEEQQQAVDAAARR